MEFELSFELREGDMFLHDGLLLLAFDVKSNNVSLMEVRCDWAFRCDRTATMLLPHPIGPVPACDRCGDPINAVYRTTPSV